MAQEQCVEFLRWAMPRLGLAWPGFRRVHRQVCKRLGRRVAERQLADFAAYRTYVCEHETEWSFIDACCHITISRFYRNAEVFDRLTREILPTLAAQTLERHESTVRAWSASCGAGEEAYSLKLAWDLSMAASRPDMRFEVVASDVDEAQLARARDACYRPSELRELPRAWIDSGFTRSGSLYCLRPERRAGVVFQRQDLRADAPPGRFDLILCRNLAITYFGDEVRMQVLAMLARSLNPGGALVLGLSERLPENALDFTPWVPNLRIYRRALAPQDQA